MASIAARRSSVRDGRGFTNPNVAVWTARRQPRAGRGLGGLRTGGGGSGGYGGGAGAIRGICTVGGPGGTGGRGGGPGRNRSRGTSSRSVMASVSPGRQSRRSRATRRGLPAFAPRPNRFLRIRADSAQISERVHRPVSGGSPGARRVALRTAGAAAACPQQTAVESVRGAVRRGDRPASADVDTKGRCRRRIPQVPPTGPAVKLAWTKLACQAVFVISFYDLLTPQKNRRSATHGGIPDGARRRR